MGTLQAKSATIPSQARDEPVDGTPDTQLNAGSPKTDATHKSRTPRNEVVVRPHGLFLVPFPAVGGPDDLECLLAARVQASIGHRAKES
jgi:hypothetical protein